jgi:hypothetical protein
MAYGTVKADVIQSDTANVPPQFNGGNGVQVGTLCRAWVNFNGTGTVAIRASFNVSSITKSSTALFTLNLTAALSDTSYAVLASGGSAGNTSANAVITSANPVTSSTAFVNTRNGANADVAYDTVQVAIFR